VRFYNLGFKLEQQIINELFKGIKVQLALMRMDIEIKKSLKVDNTVIINHTKLDKKTVLKHQFYLN
jgi:hypothetical protein